MYFNTAWQGVRQRSSNNFNAISHNLIDVANIHVMPIELWHVKFGLSWIMLFNLKLPF